MKNTYYELIKQTYTFPQKGFNLKNKNLTFYDIDLIALINKYGTPFRLTYLPKIKEQIRNARMYFENAIKQNNYQGKYHYCYCTKCNHYHHILKTSLQEKVNLETSSSMDIDLIMSLYQKKEIDKDITIIHNGYKTDEYLQKIFHLQQTGFKNIIVVLDSEQELIRLKKILGTESINIGLRMAINEEMQSSYYTSRLGIRPEKMIGFYQQYIQNDSSLHLKMIHFFVDSGIKDSMYYWKEFEKALALYTQLKKEDKYLDSFNIGGGFPIQNQLKFDYDYQDIVNKIVYKIKKHCTNESVAEPDIYTEFGKYTVGESSAIIFQVLEQKQQNDTETWYIIDNSLLNTIPDAWYLHEKFILLPINKWEQEYQRVNIGGISCDQSDYYNSEDMNQEILLPKINKEMPLYVGFFHTGAYQDAVSGYGGLKHCLVPSPKQIIVDKDKKGNLIDYSYGEALDTKAMFKILGF